MWLLPFAPLDTLDFTSFKMHVGSKLVIDASGEMVDTTAPPEAIDPTRFDSRIDKYKLLDGGFLLVVPRENARNVVQKLVRAPLGVRFVVAVRSRTEHGVEASASARAQALAPLLGDVRVGEFDHLAVGELEPAQVKRVGAAVLAQRSAAHAILATTLIRVVILEGAYLRAEGR